MCPVTLKQRQCGERGEQQRHVKKNKCRKTEKGQKDTRTKTISAVKRLFREEGYLLLRQSSIYLSHTHTHSLTHSLTHTHQYVQVQGLKV